MRIGLGFHAAAVYKYDRAVEFWAARAAVSACEIGPKYFRPVYFQKAKL
jgi:hypothetical protein